MEGEKIKKIEEEIGALENQYGSRTFSYDHESDEGYQNYLKLMQENGKKAMEDTVGKASALTGGYANSYAASAGQQVYNDFMKQGAEAQAGFRQLARDEFDAENQNILNRLGLLKEQKKSIWDDAALKAGFGDYSGYVNDLGLYESEDAAKLAIEGPVKPTAPTAEQIAYAKEMFKKGGETEMEAYVDSLVGVDTDALYTAVENDKEFQNSKEVLKKRFSLTDTGNGNLWGVNKNAKLSLDGEDPKTAKEWFEILQKDVKDGGYGLSEEDAREVLKALGAHA